MFFSFNILKLFRKKPTKRMYTCPICLSPFVDEIIDPPAECPDCCSMFASKRLGFLQGKHEARRRESSIEK